MKDLMELLSTCQARDIRLAVDCDDGNIRMNGAKGAITPEVVEAVKTHKPLLLQLLRQAQRDASAQSVWNAALERLQGDPDFPAELLADCRKAIVRWED